MKNTTHILNSILPDESKAIEAHKNVYSALDRAVINNVWRDKKGILCIEYKMPNMKTEWFHYHNETWY